MPQNLILIGQIAKVHGIRGALCLNYYAEDLELLNKQLWLGANLNSVREVKITSHSLHKNQVIIKLDGLEDRNEAEKYRNYELYIASEQLPELSEDELYIFELIGLAVFSKMSDENFQLLGHIEDIIFPAGQELWQIRSLNGKELLFPAVSEFILKFDLESKKVIIDPPAGLFEE